MSSILAMGLLTLSTASGLLVGDQRDDLLTSSDGGWSCRIECGREAAAEFRPCVRDGGDYRECLMQTGEQLRECLAGCDG